ncbi:response regulator [Aquabacter sp. CN5-332]|uniref:response regulator n=1 Tax=Aquabacter sp. CN5-332 TaxID=3156608 RepID=UPI0032B3A551
MTDARLPKVENHTNGPINFLAGGGEMGSLLRAFEWDSTLGPPEHWPQSLKTAIRIMLTSRQPIWIGWGRELIFFYNDAYKSIIGGKHPEALGRPAAEVWREIWSDIGPMLATAMGGIEGTYVEEQLLIMERNGYPEETYYTFSYSPIPDDDGNPGGIICANTDDTKRVIGERQLALLRDLAARTSEARAWKDVGQQGAAALAADARDLPFAMIYMADEEQKTLELVGAAGIVAGHFAAPASIRVADAAWPFAKVLETHETSVVELNGQAGGFPTGAWSEAPAAVALLQIPAAGETGRTGVLVVGLNRFRLFDADYRAFLGLVVGQIAAAIANADAYEQERLRAEALAELDRAKTIFFSNISHEFRTPLTLMLGPLEESLAEATALAPEQYERIAVAHRNGTRLLKLVNALLDFSRIEAGRTQASFEATDLSALTVELASNFRSATQKAGLALTVDVPPLPEPVHVDRDMWEKIVLNLLSNAFKFTFEGEIAVTLTAQRGAVTLAVRDTGTGIPEDELPHLFERFRRIEGARGRSFEGSGIGLALVQELVNLHSGAISVESEEGRGTTFLVTIPMGTAHLPADRMRGAGTAVATSGRAQAFVEEALRWLPGGPSENAIGDIAPETPVEAAAGDAVARARILVADDNADMRDYICRLLGGGHGCVAVEDGAAALSAIRANRPDLLVTDMMMPRLDGFGLIRAIREDPELRDLPIIVLSARAGEEASVEGLAAGADDYLVKPFSARELAARVDGALAMARMRQTMNEALREEASTLETLNRVGIAVAGELDLARAVQTVTDAATSLTGAAFGSFFYNVIDQKGESYMLYTLSGVPREAFSRFPMPRNTQVFAPTFNGEGVVRSDDILTDPRYGKNDPHFGMPKGHLPVRSYLAAPVVSRSGEVLGGLFFGHPEPGVFTDRAERLLLGIAAQAAIAIDNARLYRSAQSEIEERSRTEAALRESEERQMQLNQTLEAKVVARTAELEAANEQLRTQADEREKIEQVLRQAQKMEAVGKLTGGVAHDFNNLLQVIGGNLQLLSNDVAGSERAEQRLRNALAGVSRGSKLAAQLLAFGRRQPLAPKVVNLGRFVRGLDDLLRRALGDGIEIETVVSGGLWNSLVDPTQVENALLNLAINARDAMAGHGKLTIEAGNALLDDVYAALHPDVKAGQYVMLAVTDTGCGMTPEVMEHVFEPFFTTKPEGQGTGLGLSMVYGFVKQSDGHIKIYSEPGQGTTIRIYLPRVREAEDVATETEAGPITGGTETVLVVEDDEQVRSTVVDLLSDLGYGVLKARDAQSALAIIESGAAIDLLFTDVVMPGPLRSPELARKARERLPEAAVLFTSGYTDNAIVHGGRLDEGIELLSKPYTREALARKIRHVLRNQQQRNAAAAALQPDYGRGKAPARPERLLRVLLVEDDALIRFATAELLKDMGHTVFEAADGPEALVLLANEPVEVLLTDVGLPTMSGSVLAVEARRRLPTLRIVFASGRNILPSEDNEGLLADAVQLVKPYDSERLAAALKAVMR